MPIFEVDPFQIMSTWSEDLGVIEARAEAFLQRAERRILVDNWYTYEHVKKSGNNLSSVAGKYPIL